MEYLHVYKVDYMEQYLPHVTYSGSRGYIQAFCDSLGSYLFPKAKSEHFDNIEKQLWLNMANIARKLQLLENKKELILKKMNWYVRKIINLIKTDECSFDCYVYFLEIIVSQSRGYDYKCLEIELRCENHLGDDIQIKHEFEGFNILDYIQETNYFKRDYSNKLVSYAANLAELYSKYLLGKELKFDNDGRLFIFVNPTLNGSKSIQHGFIEW